jgi:hypothetical protein
MASDAAERLRESDMSFGEIVDIVHHVPVRKLH